MISDVFELARSGGSVAGSLPLDQLARLDSPSREGALCWKAVGVRGGDNKPCLDLEIDGEVVQICQRCLEPVTVSLEIRRRFFLARTEEEADSVPLDADDLEVVVGSKEFDLSELIEDEAILSLPLVPMHPRCPLLAAAGSFEVPDNIAAQDAAAIRISPFAALAQRMSREKN